jgi:hypothetical protein
MPHSPATQQFRQTTAGVLATLVAMLAAAGAEAADGDPACRWRAAGSAVVVSVDGRDAFTVEGLGPAWREHGARRGPADATVVRQSTRGPATEVAYRSADGAEWTVSASTTGEGELTVELSSSDRRFEAAAPGKVTGAGAWVGLDLSQYSLAHGQPSWPKTYDLPRSNLFLCAWWAPEVSHASRPDWPDSAADPRRGTGPFEPAATMRYTDGPDGRHEALREALHLRVARHLWDATLPSLCRPSEYRAELAGLVYLDDWSGQSADDLKHTLGVFKRLAWPHVGFLTIVQNWQAAGFDALLPDSIAMPDYPPSPAVGTVAELRDAASLGKSIGRFGFRTNYMLLRAQAPSHVRGLVDFARGPDGAPTWYTQPSRWLDLARRQEDEIARLLGPDASFTDQLDSGGHAGSYLDFNRKEGSDGTLATALAHQRALARLIKETHRGPLGTETLNQQDLIGAFCDFGDFGVMDGHDRLFSPEYKLRRLHDATVSYGCGLYYRFFELPPFPRFHSSQLDLWADPALMDDYRCCEVLLGNGGYIFWPCPWPYALTEAIVVGRLQKRYALAPVASVEYEVDGAWTSLEELVRKGFCPETRPWNQKQAELGRVRVVYGNGLTVIGNRLPAELTVTLPGGPVVLPRYGWVAYQRDGSFRAGSALFPGTRQCVDFLDEGRDGLRFLNPRGASVERSMGIRLWKSGVLLWSVDPAAAVAHLGHETLPLDRPAPAPLGDLLFDFGQGLGGWILSAGILRAEWADGGLKLVVCTDDPQLRSPPLALAGRSGDTLSLTLSTDAGRLGQVYFATTDDGMSPRQEVQFALTPDGRPHTVAIPVGKHPRWADHRVTAVRLDPIHGAPSATVVLHTLTLRRGP